VCARALVHRLVADRAGAGAVEFAIVAPLLFALLFACLELGWAIQCGSSVRTEVQQAARGLIINPGMSAADLKKKVEQRLQGLPITGFDLSVAEEWINGNARVQRVTWTYEYAMAMPLVPAVVFNFDSSVVVPTPNG
jgi:Flp pilus assembly pilin Flp